MFDFLKRKLSKTPPPREFTPEEYAQWDELKSQALERVLGPMDDIVSHAIVPYEVGGYVDLYHYEQALPGTAVVTMELVRPDGSGPRRSRIGTYELLAFTRHSRGTDEVAFDQFTQRMSATLTILGRYGEDAVLQPGQSATLPAHQGPERHVVLSQYPGLESFTIGRSRHGLLLCIEVLPSELAYSSEHGPEALLGRLREAQLYPYSDLDRPPVV